VCVDILAIYPSSLHTFLNIIDHNNVHRLYRQPGLLRTPQNFAPSS
jgi:hypothetical protein